MRVRFIGGRLDGTTDERDAWGYRYIVPHNINGRHIRETYVRDRAAYERDEHGAVTCIVFVLEQVEDRTEQTNKTLMDFRRNTMRDVLDGLLGDE